KEGAPREGFFERDQYEAVRHRLSADLQVAVAIAYTFGWRSEREGLTAERRQLDLEAGTLRLDPGTTKNDEGRVVYLTRSSKASWRPRWNGSAPSSATPSASPPSGSRTSAGRSASGPAVVTSGKPGRPPAGRPACQECTAMTSSAPPCATWSTPACPSAWR